MKIIFLVLLIFSGSCALFNPSENQINDMAAQTYEKIKSEAKISQNKEWIAMLDRVASRIAKESGETHNWEWILIESKEINAWAMPGGKIAVYTGIMPIAKTEAGLAAILGHEVAHVTLDHGKQTYARAVRGNVAGLVIGLATSIGGQAYCKSDSCRMLMGLSGAAAGFAITFFDRKFSRSNETSADQEGLKYMSRSGYDPTEAIGVWQRMGQATQGQAPPEFLSTHPAPQTREQNIKEWLPEASKEYSRAPVKRGSGETI